MANWTEEEKNIIWKINYVCDVAPKYNFLYVRKWFILLLHIPFLKTVKVSTSISILNFQDIS